MCRNHLKNLLNNISKNKFNLFAKCSSAIKEQANLEIIEPALDYELNLYQVDFFELLKGRGVLARGRDTAVKPCYFTQIT